LQSQRLQRRGILSKDEETDQLRILSEYVEDLRSYWDVCLDDVQIQIYAIKIKREIILGTVFVAGLIIGSALAKSDG
jgi:hypothetical protein